MKKDVFLIVTKKLQIENIPKTMIPKKYTKNKVALNNLKKNQTLKIL